MMGLHFMDDVPFRDVYVHALVRDAEGHKMSKSKGNVIDPLVMMDKYGTDALRFTLTALAVQGRDVKLSEERIEGYRHFINKIWNAARLVLMNLPATEAVEELPVHPESLIHRWILSRFQRLVGDAEEAMQNYHFNQYAQVLYQFVWHEYCDWYLEMIKADFYGEDPAAKQLAQSIAAHILQQVLILLHPVMPFVTEEIWQQLPQTDDTILKARFPEIDSRRLDPEAERQMDLLMEVVSGIRNIRGEMNVSPALRVDVVCLCAQGADKRLLQHCSGLVSELARLGTLQIGSPGEVQKPRMAAGAVARGVEVYVLLRDILDFDSESKRLDKEITKLEKEFTLSQKKLSNEDFLQKAPADVVEKEREKGVRLHAKLEKIRVHRERINSLRESAALGE